MTMPEDRRQAFRIGVLFTAAAVLSTAFTLLASADGSRPPLDASLFLLGIAATGIGLLCRVSVARYPAALLLIAGAVLTIRALISEDVLHGDQDYAFIDVGNALATTLLFLWLCLCGVLNLFAPHRRTTGITLRVTGAALDRKSVV